MWQEAILEATEVLCRPPTESLLTHKREDRQFSIFNVCSSTPDSVFMCPLQTCITLSEEFTKALRNLGLWMPATIGGIRELCS